LHNTLASLSDDLRIIATTTKDSDTKDILEFLAYSKEQIEEIIKSKANEENTA
jgi:ribosomal protein L18E